ncbi:hypothetical protein E2562_004753 [Oryza meyeriana var. granulata]|uniref:Uncharacterized protein n=1 Tax=Oryza meyeriana var. granulata TaxID=110450 RepID=A0A6G1DD91_9ORYZ|nr:hypothetical protein E2562_004753 [Oryza meyeriana var. granulata]
MYFDELGISVGPAYRRSPIPLDLLAAVATAISLHPAGRICQSASCTIATVIPTARVRAIPVAPSSDKRCLLPRRI